MSTFGWPEFLFLLRGAGWSIVLTAIAFSIGSLTGGFFAIMRLSQYGSVRNVAAGYITVIQSIPVLMILFMSYYGLTLFGFEIPPLLAASVSLSVYVSAYLAEIWRGSIQAVPKPQWEASASLALTRFQQYRYVILPQALRLSLPPTVGFLVQLVKNTSIVSVVGFVELSRAGQLVNNATFRPFQVFFVVALLYFAICFPLSRLSRHLERVLHVGRNN
ncbi:amino acid ABC transporter permease [Agrobacterium fabrum]|uniref:ABC transporter, membrane spanning protein (Amino acid) n=1 Tax=Agrobacterium fabrum (strain C58 / ATCC 33970) TaxID=176299 RepID=A9CJ50_AGRFC|nr:amino acid ABC transporter permease [Agrobacterium fabrum]KJX88592.1 L-cystine transport system permease protein tcyB [Agrobacterium tumefaciens]AAK87189.1 ABC transporter, membrane spanning protein (amino acid) [Agrobacterium fabrum str. C58]MCX2873777.1 amino acid ABC transporter permease [Agrobacterium fabrum]NMV67937.1 amino acid ABC transporter permease [Agrobacterium fabrum]QQN06724.1 amino acid ABC transporter permease [Agrobacterium fabrum]